MGCLGMACAEQQADWATQDVAELRQALEQGRLTSAGLLSTFTGRVLAAKARPGCAGGVLRGTTAGELRLQPM